MVVRAAGGTGKGVVQVSREGHPLRLIVKGRTTGEKP